MHIKQIAKNIEKELLKKKDIKLFKIVRNSALFEANEYAAKDEYAPIEVPELLLNEDEIILPFDTILLQTPKEKEFQGIINTSSILILKSNKDKILKFYIFRTIPQLIGISWGEFKYELIAKNYFEITMVSPSFSEMKNPETYKWVNDPTDPEIIKESIQFHVSYAARYLILINNQKRFIVETSIKEKKIRSKSKKFRSTFHVKPSRVIRDEMIISNPNYMEGNGTPLKVGHERRRHERKFRNDRYVNMKGKKIIIEATWVGPTSYTDPKDPNKIYKVRIDL
jgi:hypothetical protein